MSDQSRRRAARLTMAIAAFLAFTALAAPAYAITRSTVLARSQVWMDIQVPYSQTKWFQGYRTDCSGYVSMCWQTGTSWSTRSFHSVSSTITVDELKPGDGIHKVGHIRLFYGWIDDAHQYYMCYEQTGPTLRSSIRSIADDLAAGYHPCRYRKLTDGTPSRNLLLNPTFDVWARWWDGPMPAPVWWRIDGSEDSTQVARLMDLARTGRNALQLLNPSTSTESFTMISQIVTVTPETTYAVAAWVLTASDLGAIRISVDYLNPRGASVASVRKHGDEWPDVSDQFRLIGFVLATPADAVRARIVIRLAGGETATATEPIPGTSAILDDVALVRPYTTVSILRSRTTAYVGNTVTLSGVLGAVPSLVATEAVGRPYTVYVMRPGTSEWTVWHSHKTYASGSVAAWKCSHTFTRSMRKGTYRFRTEVPAFGDFLGSMSSTVTVTLK